MTVREDEPTDLTHAAQAARALASVQTSTTPPPIVDRAAALDAIERALRGRARRRWQRRWVLPSLAVATAAAAAAGVVLVTGASHVGPRSASPGTVAQASGDDLGPGTELRGPGSFEIAAGTRLRLDDHASARVLEVGTSRRFRLQEGALHAQVAKLTRNQRFVVETVDAEVEVKGTHFDVAVGPGRVGCTPAAQTRVTVQEGIVAVRFAGGELLLRPGQSWPDCAGATAAPGAPEASAQLHRENGEANRDDASKANSTASSAEEKVAAASPFSVARAAAGGHLERGRGKAVRSVAVERRPRAPARAATTSGVAAIGDAASTLAEQNDLMAAALSARQRGNVAEALRWLDRLLDRFPGGQLADSARAERRRLLGNGLGPEEPEPR